jgi:hypothetical protein
LPSCAYLLEVTRIAVVGATGLIGRHLVAAARARGDEVIALSRRPSRTPVPTVPWDPASGPFPDHVRRGVDAIVNLAGEPIGPRRWTPERRARILSSRLDSTSGVAAVIGEGPAVLLNASAVGIYGPTDDVVDESSLPGKNFLAELCTQWEHAAMAAAGRGRVAVLRSGIVLADDGGTFPLLARAARIGVLGKLGDGRQWVPWVHVDDEVRAILHCLDHEGVAGPVNLVAPMPVREAELARVLATALHRPNVLAVPRFAVRLAFGEAASLLLEGQAVSSKVLDDSGFVHRHPRLDGAVASLLVRGAN